MNNEEKILSMLETVVQKVDGLDARFDNLESRFDNLESRFDNLEARFDNLESRFDELEKDVQSINKVVIRIENDHGEKLKALFDSYVLMYETQKELRSDITNMNALMEKHDLIIRWLLIERKAQL